MSDLAFANADAGNCDEMEYGGAAHSRSGVEEIDLICNHKFVSTVGFALAKSESLSDPPANSSVSCA